MNDNTFSHLSEKGMYSSSCRTHRSTATASMTSAITAASRRPSAGRTAAVGQDGEFGQAIDINLKYETYSNVTFTDTVITNSGHSDRDGAGTPGTFGAAVGCEDPRRRPVLQQQSADFDGRIVFNGLSIDGTSTGVRVGEPGKDNDGPDVLLQNVTVANATVTDLANVTDHTTGGTATVEFGATQLVFQCLDVAGRRRGHRQHARQHHLHRLGQRHHHRRRRQRHP
jgi:hypothetical protein